MSLFSWGPLQCVESCPKMPWMKNIVILCNSCVSVVLPHVQYIYIYIHYLGMILFPFFSVFLGIQFASSKPHIMFIYPGHSCSQNLDPRLFHGTILFSINGVGTPISFILIGFSIINHPFNKIFHENNRIL